MPIIDSKQECPGSVEENRHNLFIINPESGNLICMSDKCYFAIKYKDGSGAWSTGFDYTNAKSYIKPQEQPKEIKN